MFKKIILSLCLISNLSYADVIQYNNISGVPMKMDKNLYEQFKYNYNSYLNNLSECKEHRFDYVNPSHGANGFFEIRGVKNKRCLIVLNLNSTATYKCMITKSDIKKLKSYRENYLDNIEYVETFSKEERKILNNKKCLIDFKETNNISKKQLNEIIKKNPSVEAMIKGFGGVKK